MVETDENQLLTFLQGFVAKKIQHERKLADLKKQQEKLTYESDLINCLLEQASRCRVTGQQVQSSQVRIRSIQDQIFVVKSEIQETKKNEEVIQRVIAKILEIIKILGIKDRELSFLHQKSEHKKLNEDIESACGISSNGKLDNTVSPMKIEEGPTCTVTDHDKKMGNGVVQNKHEEDEANQWVVV